MGAACVLAAGAGELGQVAGAVTVAGFDFQNSHQPAEDAEEGELGTDIEAGLASAVPTINPPAYKLTAAETSQFFATTKSSLSRTPRRHPCRAQIARPRFYYCVVVPPPLVLWAGNAGTRIFSMNFTLVTSTTGAGRPSAIKPVSYTCGI